MVLVIEILFRGGIMKEEKIEVEKTETITEEQKTTFEKLYELDVRDKVE